MPVNRWQILHVLVTSRKLNFYSSDYNSQFVPQKVIIENSNVVVFQITLRKVDFCPHKYPCQETTFTDIFNFLKKSIKVSFVNFDIFITFTYVPLIYVVFKIFLCLNETERNLYFLKINVFDINHIQKLFRISATNAARRSFLLT